MQHLTTYRTSGWPADRPHTRKEKAMDPVLAKLLVDASVPVPPTRGGSPRRPRASWLRPWAATLMRRLADRLDAPVPRPATCQ
ncbi:MAG TPA: hypothetical protein VK906_00575 [Egicoccus sp.]|nr:hypothetical protein [Egicoccus sp.]HSK21633.1 hypothetical protein [Egicoccus sp.]